MSKNTIIITSFKEPHTIGKAIQSFLDQNILQEDLKKKKKDFEIIVSAPDKETLDVASKISKKDKRVIPFQDPGKGKMFALNMLFKKLKNKSEILILSDGDVYVGENSLKFILEQFKDEKVGCVTGRPVSLDSRDNMLGYWSHLLCDAGAHKARLKRHNSGSMVECSGYYWAFRNNVVEEFPLDVPEDAIIPYYFWQKDFKVTYAQEAKVYVSYPKNLHDFIDQKKRTSKAHVQMGKYVDFSKYPKTKTFKNEFFESYRAFFYPRSLKEVYWTILLFPAKLYVWLLVYYQLRVMKKEHKDGWQVTKSTKVF
ncbi:hypothetical protein COU57_05950 [Candidatus Pacearchaeota archaeon CG10_big_fil_rev_8_21_14_0_10_32_14]|nr:MAG: hypothetical protein COU57_05950 [Candidatus Pacearchaeota archaeon CG10_big_fil_rev_8_21_14_0_10_32_14]